MRTASLLFAALLTLGAAAPSQAGTGWLTDFEEAKAKAKQEGKAILADFTGSDWCVYCKKLDKEVFQTAEFKAWAKDKLVLLELDYPARKKQPDGLKAQNKKLAKTYKIEGYPTVVLMAADGTEFARTGYRPGGPGPWIEHAEPLLAKQGAAAKPSEPQSTAPTAGAWTEDYQAALAAAKKTGKLILTDFTGSDWCGWCIKLKEEVFSKPEFTEWAKENVILLELDFPKRTPQDEKIKAQNRELLQKHGVRGFPTILFIDAKGNAVGKMGYMQGGPGPWIEKAQSIVDAQTK